MQGAGGGGWSRLRAPSFGAGGRRGAAAEEAAGSRSGSQPSSAPAEAGICSRLFGPLPAQMRTCRVSVTGSTAAEANHRSHLWGHGGR